VLGAAQQIEHAAPAAAAPRAAGVAVAWQKSSNGRRAHQRSSSQRRSTRSTTSTLCGPMASMRDAGSSKPKARSSCAHSHSFSSDVLIAGAPPGTAPSGNLRMWVLGVAPRGTHQRAPLRSNAVLGRAPPSATHGHGTSADDVEPSSGATQASSSSANSRSDNGSPSTRIGSPGSESGASSCTAPTQSRPTAASRSNVSALATPNAHCKRWRGSAAAGSRWSKYACTRSPRAGRALPSGSDSDNGRASGAPGHALS
jgi:hypothetical protein